MSHYRKGLKSHTARTVSTVHTFIRCCCQPEGTGWVLSLCLHKQQNAVVLLNVLNVLVIPFSVVIKYQLFFSFPGCLLYLTFKRILSHIIISLTLLSSHMLPAGSSCLPFLKIHFEVLYLAFSLGIVFLHHEGVSNPAELCFQNYYFAIIWENVLFLILSCYCPFVITQRCCVLQFIILYSIILAHTYFNENSVLAQKSLSLEDHQSGCLDTLSILSGCCFPRHLHVPPYTSSSGHKHPSWQHHQSLPSSLPSPSHSQGIQQDQHNRWDHCFFFFSPCNDFFVGIDQRWVSNQRCMITVTICITIF